MEDCKILLDHGSEGNLSFVSEDGDSQMTALPPFSASVPVDQEHDRNERLISLPNLKEQAEGLPPPLPVTAQTFLTQYVAPAVLEVFPEWQGILIESPTLDQAVWIVRDSQTGRRLAQETGHPFLLLDESLALAGRSENSPCWEIPPEDTHLKRVKSGLKPTEFALGQSTTKESGHEDDAKNLVE